MLVRIEGEMKAKTIRQKLFALEEFSTDPFLARAVKERLSKLRARQAREGKYLLREARQLRQKLMKEIRDSHSH